MNSCFQSFSLHPATRLVLWLLLLVFVQSLSGIWLGMGVVFLLALPSRVLRRGGRLVWRTRWLLLSLLVIFSWGVAGDPLWSGVGAPTYEGVVEALTHLARLILVLMLVAAFLEEVPIADLLSATHTVFAPLRRVGFDADRGVIRLMLVLRYVEALPRARDWRSLLDVPPIDEHEWVEIDQPPFGCFDLAVIVVVLPAGLLVCYFGFL